MGNDISLYIRYFQKLKEILNYSFSYNSFLPYPGILIILALLGMLLGFSYQKQNK